MAGIIETRGVLKKYRTATEEIIPLEYVDFYADEGEMVLIYGPSGSGKTTFLNILCGIDTPDAGELYFRGEPYHHKTDKELTLMRRWHMGVIYQSFELIRVMSCYDNIVYPLFLQGKMDKAYVRERITFYAEALGIQEILFRKPSEVSGGQSQRVAICRALVGEYPLVLGDEITSNLDADTTMRVYDFLHALSRQEKRTFVLVSHNVELKRFADRIFHLRGGKLCQE